MEQVEVKVGQIWRNWDVRLREVPDDADEAGKFEVLEIDKDHGLAIVRAIKMYPKKKPYKRSIRLDRFKPDSTGYKLLKWEPRSPEAPVQKAILAISDEVKVLDDLKIETKP